MGKARLLAISRLVGPLLLICGAPLAAQDDAPWAGHYFLEGVMETGSELLLRPDGRFQWYLVYGALDLFAEGQWTQKDGQIILTAEPTKDVPRPGFAAMTLTPRDGALVPPDGRGAYRKARADD